MKPFFAFLLSIVCLGVPVSAFAAPLSQGDQAIAFDFQYSKQADGSETDAFATYYWYTGATQRTGAAMLWSAGDTNGGAVGPAYDLLMGSGDLKVILGGDVAFLAGDLQDAAQMAVVTRVGLEYTIGDSGTAIRIMPRWVKAVNQDAPGSADAIDEFGFTVGILLGIPRPAPAP
jgi:hypothetical protein